MQKKTFLLAIILGLAGLAIGSSKGFCQQAEETTIKASAIVEVYYFHRSRRCASCNNIENLTRRAVLEQFSSEVENGTVALKIINVDTDKETTARFRTGAPALIVFSNSGGKDNIVNFTSNAYRYAANQEMFFSELKKEIDQYLNP
jgi:hypothetical protein